MTLDLRDDIRGALLNFVDQFVPGVIESVWLTGSRVRGNARSDSDWDLCEVTTHIRGLNYGSYQATIQKVREKFERQRAYAGARLGRFKSITYQLWSPYVPKGFLTDNLATIEGLELVVNASYRAKVETLTRRAKTDKQDTGNPFFRTLQIMAAMRAE